MKWLRYRRDEKAWRKAQQFTSEMCDHRIDKIVIERVFGSDWAELTVYVDGKDEPFNTNEFINGSPIKKWLRKHFYML